MRFDRRHKSDTDRFMRKVLKRLSRSEARLDHVDERIDLVLAGVRKLIRMEAIMATDLSALTAAVAADTEVDSSAITLLNNLSAMLADAKTDPVAIQAIADSLTANSAALAAAVVANTPVAG